MHVHRCMGAVRGHEGLEVHGGMSLEMHGGCQRLRMQACMLSAEGGGAHPAHRHAPGAGHGRHLVRAAGVLPREFQGARACCPLPLVPS